MKLFYDPETDSLYIYLNARPGIDAQEIVDGMVVDFDAEGPPVGIDIRHEGGAGFASGGEGERRRRYAYSSSSFVLLSAAPPPEGAKRLPPPELQAAPPEV